MVIDEHRQPRSGGVTPMQGWETPTIVDYGSIAEHTFSRCNPQVSGNPKKDFIDVPHHIDNHLECSATGDDGGGLS
jgi:hypothetical protein